MPELGGIPPRVDSTPGDLASLTATPRGDRGEEDTEEQRCCDPLCWRIHRMFTPRFTLILFTTMNFWTYYDRGAIASALSNVRSDPVIDGSGGTISDAKGGAIVSAFMVGFFLTCPMFAALGGTFSAKQIITAGLTVWCLACLATAFSQSYWMIVIARCFVGVGEAAYAGYTVTIIDNIAPKHSRTMWIGTYYSMIPVGTAIGMTAGGVLSKLATIGPIPGWRVVFATEIIPMLPIVILNGLMPKKYNPVKGSSGDNADDAETASEADSEPGSPNPEKKNKGGDEFVSLPTAIKGLICNLDYVLLVFGYAMYTFVLGAIAVWAISMLEQGPLAMPTITASIFMGGATAITGLLGSICGGLFVDKMGGSQGTKGILKCAKYNVLMMSLSVPVGAIALWSSSTPLFAVLFVLGVFMLFSVTAPVNASLLSAVPLEYRTYSISFSVFFMHMLGDFPSPIIAGTFSDMFSGGCDALSPHTYANATRTHQDDATSKLACEALTNCRWMPAQGIENPSCVNIYQLRNALLLTWAFLFLAIPAWSIVGCRAARRLRREEEAAGTAQADYLIQGKNVNGTASNVSMTTAEGME